MLRHLLFAIPLIVMFSVSSLANEYPRIEIFGGYQPMNEPHWAFTGFKAEIACNFHSTTAIVGEVGLFDTAEWRSDGDRMRIQPLTFLAGPRFGYRADRFRLFGQMLFGSNRSDWSMRRWDAVSTDTGSSSAFAFSFGGGIEMTLNERLTLRPAQVDYLRSRIDAEFDPGVHHQWRYSFGMAINFGHAGK